MRAAKPDDHYAALDDRLVAATRGVRLLGSVSWPAAVELQFLATWRSGNAQLPQITYPGADFSATRAALEDIVRARRPRASARRLHPPHRRVLAHRHRAARRGRHAGTSPRTRSRLFGRPGDRVPGAQLDQSRCRAPLHRARRRVRPARPRATRAAHELPAETLRDDLQQQPRCVLRRRRGPRRDRSGPDRQGRGRRRRASACARRRVSRDYDREQLLSTRRSCTR